MNAPQTAVTPQCPNQFAPVAFTVVLTDDDAIHDERVITPSDLGRLNEVAQRETGGELWWEIRLPVDGV